MNNYNDYCAGCFWVAQCSEADMDDAIRNGCDHRDIDTMNVNIEDLLKWRDEIAVFQGEWQQYIECREMPRDIE